MSGTRPSIADITPGSSYETSGVVTPPGSSIGIPWFGIVTGTTAPAPTQLAVSNGPMGPEISVAGGSAAFRNATLAALGAPDSSAGLAVSGTGTVGTASDLIAYRFLDTPLPAGESLLLWDDGIANGNLVARFDVTAADGNTPVDTAAWSFQSVSPFSQPTGAQVTAGGGAVSIADGGAPAANPQAVIVVTPNGPITSVTVRAQTGIGDTWGLAFATNAVAQNNAPCFLAGSAILTPGGPVPVEHLAPGDDVVARFGGVTRVVWTGRVRIDPRRHPRPEEVWPFRVRRDAVAPGVPARDLWLSPDHAVFLGGVLIPVKYLANGGSIAQDRSLSRIEYWHVELARHDVLLAEALPVESYLDTGNRAAFDDGGVVRRLHPRIAPQTWEADACAPLCGAGPVVDHVRARLLARAAQPAAAPVRHAGGQS